MRRLNWEAPQSLEDLEFLQAVYTEEFLERLRLIFGASYSSAWWGVVDDEKPASAQVSDTRPLVVRANSAQPLTIDVLSGIAVTQTGERIVLTAAQAQRSLADTGSGAINVVYLRSFEEADKIKLDDYDVLVPSRYNTPDDEDLLQVATLSDWLAFTSVERESFVALAVVTVQPISTGGYELSIDMTQNSYTWNRKWFSPVDIAHRTQVGTGTTTEHNPHGLQINDMVAGDLTLWQLLLDYGVVVAEDEDYAKVPGVECEQIVLTGSIAIDVTGAITGIVNSYYVTLLYYPSTIVRITDNATELEELAGDVVPGTRILYFRPSEKFSDGTAPNTKDLKIHYTWVQTGHPVITVPQSNLEVSNAPARQALIAAGLQITDLDDETLDFVDAGGIPKRYHTFIDATKTVRKRDQVVFCTKKLDDVGTAIEPFVIAPWGPGKLKVALTGATSGPVPPTLIVELKLTGKDESGVTISENVIFDLTWEENLPGAASENPNQFRETTLSFTEITQWQVVNRVADGPNSAVMMWMEQNPVTSSIMADVLPLFDCFWDGTQILDLVDMRPVNTIAENPTKTPLLAAVEVQKDLAGEVAIISEVGTVTINPHLYFEDRPHGVELGVWEQGFTGALLQSQAIMMRTDPSQTALTNLRIPLGPSLPPVCEILQIRVPYWLYGTGTGTARFGISPWEQDSVTGFRLPLAVGNATAGPTPAPAPPAFTPWTTPDYWAIMNTAPAAVDQNAHDYYIEVSYVALGVWIPDLLPPYMAATEVTYQEDVVSTTGAAWTLGGYIAEDFRSPLWMDGTQSTLSKDVDGLGVRDTYVSRPIPVEGESGSNNRLRVVIFGADNEASITLEYRYADSTTGVWSLWLPAPAPVGPHTINIPTTINKIQVRLNPDGDEESNALGIGIIHWSRP